MQHLQKDCHMFARNLGDQSIISLTYAVVGVDGQVVGSSHSVMVKKRLYIVEVSIVNIFLTNGGKVSLFG